MKSSSTCAGSCSRSSTLRSTSAENGSIVVLQVNDIWASHRRDYVSGELANSFARSERVDQVRTTAVREAKTVGVRVSVRDDRERRPSEVLNGFRIARNRNDGRVAPGVELQRNPVRVQRAVAGEVAMADEQHVSGRSALRRHLPLRGDLTRRGTGSSVPLAHAVRPRNRIRQQPRIAKLRRQRQLLWGVGQKGGIRKPGCRNAEPGTTRTTEGPRPARLAERAPESVQPSADEPLQHPWTCRMTRPERLLVSHRERRAVNRSRQRHRVQAAAPGHRTLAKARPDA